MRLEVKVQLVALDHFFLLLLDRFDLSRAHMKQLQRLLPRQLLQLLLPNKLGLLNFFGVLLRQLIVLTFKL